jgi:hypothetical protein
VSKISKIDYYLLYKGDDEPPPGMRTASKLKKNKDWSSKIVHRSAWPFLVGEVARGMKKRLIGIPKDDIHSLSIDGLDLEGNKLRLSLDNTTTDSYSVQESLNLNINLPEVQSGAKQKSDDIVKQVQQENFKIIEDAYKKYEQEK